MRIHRLAFEGLCSSPHPARNFGRQRTAPALRYESSQRSIRTFRKLKKRNKHFESRLARTSASTTYSWVSLFSSLFAGSSASQRVSFRPVCQTPRASKGASPSTWLSVARCWYLFLFCISPCVRVLVRWGARARQNACALLHCSFISKQRYTRRDYASKKEIKEQQREGVNRVTAGKGKR